MLVIFLNELGLWLGLVNCLNALRKNEANKHIEGKKAFLKFYFLVLKNKAIKYEGYFIFLKFIQSFEIKIISIFIFYFDTNKLFT